ncbi:hypothetical protein K458DRAFT_83901 [Lentithecium fluviatile CBS 122367]|uniref:DUF6535 domain-containing protein n=1 Tax=Lentithecium fluviatile CBS 122367 TaxID=1168545 RepID=A0A6G1ITT5_9PLEO|nr:hypothetical protein K458DRAFT_83901 [Lentithecium fluviatile CBS 122367]
MADRAAVTPEEVTQRTSWTFFIVKAAVAIITAPYRRTFKLYTWQPLREFRAAEGNRKLMTALARDFKTDKYAELQSVQVAASFCAGATLATLPWSRSQNGYWVADALWFSSLSCSIWAVITSIQTKSILDDLPSKEAMISSLPESEVQRMQRTILRYRKTPGISHWIMIFIWQFPSMTMSYAWATFLAGLTVYICNPFIRDAPWGIRHKVCTIAPTSPCCSRGCLPDTWPRTCTASVFYSEQIR